MHAICENATVMRSSGIYTIVYPSETFSNHLSLPDADKMHCLLLLAYVQKKKDSRILIVYTWYLPNQREDLYMTR